MKNNTTSRPNIGIIGNGSFGALAAKHLAKFASIKSYDIRESSHTLDEVMDCEWIILAIPLKQLRSVIKKIKPMIKPSTVLIDVCSVKKEPIRIFAQTLPDHHNVVFTHPLFGPQSVKSNLSGHSLIICNQNKASQAVANFCQKTLGLKISHMSPSSHDKLMAQMHALTFFVARSLNNFGLQASPFQAPSFQMLLDLVKLDKSQSQELFETVELGNHNAAKVRRDFIKTMIRLDKDLHRTF